MSRRARVNDTPARPRYDASLVRRSHRCHTTRVHVSTIEVSWRGIGLVAVACLAVGCSHSTRPHVESTGKNSQEECRVSPYAHLKRTSDRDDIRLYVPGDKNLDVPGVEISLSEDSGSTIVRLRGPQAPLPIEAEFELSFEQMVNRYPIPESLPAGDAWRRMLGNALFTEICDRPDPSLERLLDPDSALHWYAGKPAMPRSYAVFDAPRREWVEYLGANHRRLSADATSDELVVLGRAGNLELRRSGHGAVVVDTRAQRYAWVYVYAGGRKLRWPSVIGGEIQPDAVTLQLATQEGEKPAKRVRIELR